jgi:hypothetical protein
MSRQTQALLSLVLLCIGVCGWGCKPTQAEVANPVDHQAATAEASPVKNEVKLGLYITSLYDLDMAKRSFNAVFWAWFKSDDSAFKPLETVEVTNARTVVTRYPYRLDLTQKGGGVSEAATLTAAKYYVNIAQDWDTVYFPFDRQQLKIYFEDSAADVSEMQFVADAGNSGLDADVTIPGWTIENWRVYTDKSSYNSNFGVAGATVPSLYSRVVAEVTVKRTGLRLFLNIYAGVFRRVPAHVAYLFHGSRYDGRKPNRTLRRCYLRVRGKQVHRRQYASLDEPFYAHRRGGNGDLFLHRQRHRDHVVR